MRRAVVIAGAALVLALGSGAIARADGDPASDLLLPQDVYLPFSAHPGSASSRRLAANVANAYAHGYRLKVAVIATSKDLGAVPSLYGQPARYASFLGKEIRFYYGGPLLVVMPAGFGIYDQGLPTTSEKTVLKRVRLKAGSADELTATAATAVRALVTARALASEDTTPPYVTVFFATAPHGQTATLRFYVADDSKQATATLEILNADTPLFTQRFRYTHATLNRLRIANWLVPPSTQPGVLQVCVTASDPSGNQSERVCDKLNVT